eukprot:GHVQ01013953.1.p1 GENE.GHVQ01013953.1~~GHVQ01013953.1.p1  ORF type:complete len:509 (-),score=56.03 GHVQ01013953.1:768-2294(-)
MTSSISQTPYPFSSSTFPTAPPPASSGQSGLVSGTANISTSYYGSPFFPSSPTPLTTPPRSLFSPAVGYSNKGVITKPPPVKPSPVSSHVYKPSPDPAYSVCSLPSAGAYASSYPTRYTSSSVCPYPIPCAVNYAAPKASEQGEGHSEGPVGREYVYYTNDEIGRLTGSPPVRIVSPVTGSEQWGSDGVRYGYQMQGGPSAATPRTSKENSVPVRKSRSVFSCGVPAGRSGKGKGARRKKANRWDDLFNMGLSEMFPCVVDWMSPSPAGRKSGRDKKTSQYDPSSYSTSYSNQYDSFGCGQINDKEDSRRGKTLLERAATTLIGEEGWSLINDYLRSNPPGEAYERRVSESPGICGLQHLDKPPCHAQRNSRRGTVPTPIVDAVCVRCGEVLKSNPLDVDDDKLARILETEVAQGSVNKPNKNVGHGSLLADLVEGLWDRISETSNEDDKVPLPEFAAGPPRKFTKSTDKNKDDSSLDLRGAADFCDEAFPTDATGKVALPAFSLSGS